MLKKYLSLVKFSHTIFAMPFAIIGFVLGYRDLQNAQAFWSWNFSTSGSSPIVKLLLVVLCMIFARSAAMAFNRYLDRHFDALNPRTAIREIPAGILKAESVLGFTIASSLLFVLACLFINPLCLYLSPVALLVVLGYSYTKRFTALCHLVLGLGLSLAPIGAYLAVTGQFSWIPVLFSLTVIGWVSGFDIIYSLQDEEFDKLQQLNSIPAALGKKGALRVSEVLHAFAALLVGMAGFYGGFGVFYWIGLTLFCGMLVYQHWLVKPNDLSRVNLAFMTANGIASVVFAVFVVADLLIN
jgi:4-hydroxybenzoate polyprenyltransferase